MINSYIITSEHQNYIIEAVCIEIAKKHAEALNMPNTDKIKLIMPEHLTTDLTQ